MFRPLAEETAEKIARREVARVLERSGMKRRRLDVDVTPAVLSLLLARRLFAGLRRPAAQANRRAAGAAAGGPGHRRRRRAGGLAAAAGGAGQSGGGGCVSAGERPGAARTRRRGQRVLGGRGSTSCKHRWQSCVRKPSPWRRGSRSGWRGRRPAISGTTPTPPAWCRTRSIGSMACWRPSNTWSGRCASESEPTPRPAGRTPARRRRGTHRHPGKPHPPCQHAGSLPGHPRAGRRLHQPDAGQHARRRPGGGREAGGGCTKRLLAAAAWRCKCWTIARAANRPKTSSRC